MTGLDVVSRLTTEMIEDAVEDGIIYTEIRTTPKNFGAVFCSRFPFLF
jgi:adenosine deaminase